MEFITSQHVLNTKALTNQIIQVPLHLQISRLFYETKSKTNQSSSN